MLNKTRNVFQGIRFKTWMYFVVFSLCILALIMLFQIFLFEPYYREVKRSDVKKAVENIAINIENDEELRNITINNDGCAVIVKSKTTPKVLDYIGLSCLIYSNGKVNTEIVNSLRESETGELERNFVTTLEEDVEGRQEVLIYGKTFFDEDEKPYYILFNTPIEPLNSTIRIMQTQFVLISGLVLFLAMLISFFFSSLLSRPISKMTREAQKLSTGDYDVNFEKAEFKEMNDLAETLNFAAKQLSQIDELRKDVIANVSHDIKTPLTMITAYAEMVRDISGSNKAKRNEHLEVIIQESHYLDSLVSDMRNLSLLQAGVSQLRIENFDLGEVINKTADRFRTITKQEKIVIDREVESELVCIGDASKIQEVIYNFLGNAIKHFGDDRKIIIRAFTTPRSKIRVEVIDHGPGIEPDTLNHIWERYYKTDKSYQRANSGTGLGLAISKAILEQHDATFGVISEVGKGSTFYFELPNAINGEN